MFKAHRIGGFSVAFTASRPKPKNPKKLTVPSPANTAPAASSCRFAVEQPRQAFDETDAAGLFVARDLRAGVFDERVGGRGAARPQLHTPPLIQAGR
jgi:hypothetical protein